MTITKFINIQLTIDGYSFSRVVGSPSGIFTDNTQTVTYVYTKNPVVGADVTILYKDTDGNTIAPDIIKSGNVGDSYSSEQLTIDGYSFKYINGNSNGTITNVTQIITYVYTKNKIISAIGPSGSVDSEFVSAMIDFDMISATKNNSLPNTGEKNPVVFNLLGVLILGLAGILYFWFAKTT